MGGFLSVAGGRCDIIRIVTEVGVKQLNFVLFKSERGWVNEYKAK